MKRILLLIFALSIYAGNVYSADPLNPEVTEEAIYIGPVAGVNIVNHSTELQVIQGAADDLQDANGNPLCPVFTDGGNTGFFVGISGEFVIGKAATSNQGIIGRVLYSTMPASFEVESPSYPVRGSSTTGNYDQSTAINRMELTYDLITIEAQYKYNLFEGFGIIAGPSVDLVMTAEETRTMELTNKNYQFEGYTLGDPNFVDAQTRNLKPGDPAIEDASGVRVALKFGAQYEISLPGYIVVPNINYNFGVTNLNDTDWSVSALQLGVDVRFAL